MEEITFRLLIVGDSGVGKSCILVRFTQGIFSAGVDLTIGVDFATKTVQILNKQIKLQVWDTAGQEGYRSITRSFYRNADGIFLVFNVNKKSSFDHCESWINEIRNNSPPEALIFLLGNQCDVHDGKEVSIEDAENFVSKHDLDGYIETSAKEDKGVQEAFHGFCEKVYQKFGDKKEKKNEVKEKSVERISVKFDVNTKKKKKKCC